MSKPRLPSRSSIGIHAGYTLFELLAVLTVIAIGLSILSGAYNSWGTAHAFTGATRVVEAGLQQARALAMSQRAYVAFSYSTTNSPTEFRTFFCVPTNDTASVEFGLQQTSFNSLRDDITDIPDSILNISHATTPQRLSGHVRLAYLPESVIASGQISTAPKVTLLFRPDGSVFTLGVTPVDTYAHHICVYTQDRFHRGNNDTAHINRLIRIEHSSGLTTVIGEATP